jgi:hypothetical protein
MTRKVDEEARNRFLDFKERFAEIEEPLESICDIKPSLVLDESFIEVQLSISKLIIYVSS